jgi:hypothetical protein
MKKKSTSICFNEDGPINSRWASFLAENQSEEIFLIPNGTKAASDLAEQMTQADFQSSVKKIVCMKAPEFEVRVLPIVSGQSISSPYYAWDMDTIHRWACTKLAAPLLDMASREIGKRTLPIKMDEEQTSAACYMALRMWNILILVEETNAIPASIMALIIPHTVYITEEGVNTVALNHAIGGDYFSFHRLTRQLMIDVGSETFTIGLPRLLRILTEAVLPFYRTIKTRKLEWFIKDNSGDYAQHSFFEFGIIVHQIMSRLSIRHITEENPVPDSDLIMLGKKAEFLESHASMIKKID